MTFENILLADLKPSPTNPRKEFDKNRIEDMAESIRTVGLLEPILVVKREGFFEIVAGETRYRAALRVPMKSMPCVVREMSQKEIIHAQMAENISRSSLNPMEEAEGLKQMIELGGADEESISKALGTTRKWVQARLSLNDLPDCARDAVRIRAMSVIVAQEILALDKSERLEATEMLLNFGEEITGAQARQTLSERYRLPRERRQQWMKRWDESLSADLEKEADPLEDCEQWSRYLRPYGEAYGKWILGSEVIGAAAVDPADAGITWRELAKALGIRGLVVPLHGSVYLVFDKSKIEAAESASREAGKAHTLGPRKKSNQAQEPEPVTAVEDEAPEDDEDMDEYYVSSILTHLSAFPHENLINHISDIVCDYPEEIHTLISRIGKGHEIAALISLRKENQANG